MSWTGNHEHPLIIQSWMCQSTSCSHSTRRCLASLLWENWYNACSSRCPGWQPGSCFHTSLCQWSSHATQALRIPQERRFPKSTSIPPEDMHCTHEQQVKLDELLLTKYKDMFVTDDDELGYTGTVKHKIFTSDDIPVNQPFRRIPPRTVPRSKRTHSETHK